MRNTARKKVRNKWLARRLRNALIGVMRAVMRAVIRRRPAPSSPNWGSRPHRVLYLRYDKIGDMILATGIIRAIAQSQATLTVDVLASRANATVLRGNPHVGRVILFEKKRPWTYWRTWRAMRGAHYDAVIDTKVQSSSFTDATLMLLSGAPHRIGVADRETEFVLTVAVPPVSGAEHYLDHSSALVGAFRNPVPTTITLGDVDVRPQIILSPEEARRGAAAWTAGAPRLLVNASAGDSSRYWPEAHFVATLRAVRARYPAADIVITGSPVDRERSGRIASATGATVARTPGVRDAFAVVAASDLVLTADTSITHVASAFGKPAIVLFPRNRGALYGPFRTAGRALTTPEPAIKALPVEPVMEALLDLLAAGPGKLPTDRQDAGVSPLSVRTSEAI